MPYIPPATPLLDALSLPDDILTLPPEELATLAAEVRARIIDVVARNGGHLAPSLGVVELTLALLATGHIRQDKIVWDVGHQTYAWKLLTGRADRFHTLRRMHGLSGFTKPEESEFDHFGVGHSSTSISAALGMAMARDLAGLHHRVIAVIGDGSLTAGQAFEGLNMAGHEGRRLIVVLNDNEMAISPNVGALSRFLSRTLSRRWVRQMRRDVLGLVRSIPRIGHDLATYAMRGEWSFKSFFTPGMLFEAFRFTYIGPVDGHDIGALCRHLNMAAAVEDGPVLLHVLTRKGKGYAPAENNPTYYHGLGGFEPDTGLVPPTSDGEARLPTYTDIFGRTLTEMAAADTRIIAITAAMPEGSGTSGFAARFPERFVDVGICEQHAVTFAGGLAMQGLRPVVAIYSTFLQRAYDQVVHDICLQNLPVTFCLDRAGLVGEDGPTHHGVFDIAYLRHVPNIRLLAPRDEGQLRHALYTAVNGASPTGIRYPRGTGLGGACDEPLRLLPEGQGAMLQEGTRIAVIALGTRACPALEAARLVEAETGVRPFVFDPVWIKPLPAAQLCDLAARCNTLFFVEEASLAGGFSSAVLELLADTGMLRGQTIKRLGLPDVFIEHGPQRELRALQGLRADGIARVLRELVRAQGGAHS